MNNAYTHVLLAPACKIAAPIVFILAGLLLPGHTFAQVHQLDWGYQFVGSNNVYPYANATDLYGNVINVGGFTHIYDFDIKGGVHFLTPNTWSSGFIQKLNPAGNLQNAIAIGPTGSSGCRSVATDGLGNIYVAGVFSNTIDFDPDSTSSYFLTAPNPNSLFFLKLDPSLNFIWARMVDNDLSSNNTVALEVDSTGNMYSVFNFGGPTDFDPDSISAYILNSTDGQIGLLKLDASGSFVWGRQIGDGASCSIRDLDLSHSGNMYLAGHFDDTIDVDPTPGVVHIANTINGRAGFAMSVDPNGMLRWANVAATSGVWNTSGSKSLSVCNGIGVDSQDNVYVSGSWAGVIDLDPSPATLIDSTFGNKNHFVQKLDSAGNLLWVRTIYDAADPVGSSVHTDAKVEVDANDNVVAVVNFDLSPDIDPGPGVHTVPGIIDTWNMYFQRFNPTGDFVWGGYISANGYSQLKDISYAGDVLHLLGRLGGSGDVDPGSGVHNLFAGLPNKTFIDKLNTCYPAHTTHTASACSSFTWIDGITYTSSTNSATYTYPDALGFDCDSIITLDLTIGPATSTDSIHTCDSLTWIDGITYYSNNNTATHTYPGVTANGCDSIVTLNLSMGPLSTTDQIVACDSVTWIDGNTYTTSNSTANQLFTTAQNCDSLVQLDLTLGYSTITIDSSIACDSFTWIDGLTYTASNDTASYMLQSDLGCDSLVLLNLAVNPSMSSIDSIAGCDSFTWIDGVSYTASTSGPTHMLTTSQGCDSLVTLALTMAQSSTTTENITACIEYTWSDGNTYYASNNSATQLFTSTAGCDSVIQLDLTINEVDVAVTTLGASLGANAILSTYQWLDCDNGYAELPGQTGQLLARASPGSYAVVVETNNCIDTSTCYPLNITGISPLAYSPAISALPNPTSGKLLIRSTSLAAVQIRVLNVTGRLVQEHHQDSSAPIELTLDGPAGIYIIEATQGNTTQYIRVVKL